MKKYKDVIAGGVLFVTGLVYFILSFSIKRTYIDQVVGSRLLPQICGVLLMLLAAILIYFGIRNALALPKETGIYTAPQKQETEHKQAISPAIKTLLVLVCFTIFVWLLDKIGFAFSVFFYLFSQMLLMADKRLTRKNVLFYFLLSFALAFGIYYLFYRGFSLMLPKASWF